MGLNLAVLLPIYKLGVQDPSDPKTTASTELTVINISGTPWKQYLVLGFIALTVILSYIMIFCFYRTSRRLQD